MKIFGNKTVNRFLCWTETIQNTIQYFFRTGKIIPVMGHLYSINEIHRNCIVSISWCEYCGHMSMAWQPEGSITDQELIKLYGTTNGFCDCSKNPPLEDGK
jgi:hypothetical protein